jgi:Reverse transcriptase (RNA-dependent DNA polymerase)
VTELPEGKRSVGCRWIYSIKYNADGTVKRYKARLVTKGYTQMYEVDFQDTFSPVIKLNIVRVLLPLAANMDWPLHQFDVKNIFLHGEIKEEIYMDLPPGFRYSGPKNIVCKLKKALYGLKQSPRVWFRIFFGAMKKYGFDQCDSDHTLFIKRKGDKLTVLIIYVDDMIITGNDEEEMHRLEEKLS